MLIALINTFATLAKSRPALIELIVQAMVHWDPNSNAELMRICTPTMLKSVDKAAYIFLLHLSRYGIQK